MAAKQRKKRAQPKGLWRKIKIIWKRLPVKNGWIALLLLNLVVLMTGAESAWVQTATTYRSLSWDLLAKQSFWLLLCLDIFLPLTVALLSRRAFFAYLIGQCFLSTILLHYTIFFYNPLTLSSIYHSMQGAASLGIDIFGFARIDIILLMGALLVFKCVLVRMSWLPDKNMPAFWQKRGITAVGCMTVIWLVSNYIYGKTGLSPLWVDSRGARTTTERRLEEGTREAVRNIGYIGTWVGEWLSGTYKDTDLIYTVTRCSDPDITGLDITESGSHDAHETMDADKQAAASWMGLPLPPVGDTVVMIQVESLDFSALGMLVNGHQVMPFLNLLGEQSLFLKTFAPHKVGSSNSDYEILNTRIADQNVIYYSYIKDYPDSIIRVIRDKGFDTSIFHGLNGYLFNLRDAYTSMGFRHLYFKEELLQAGYGPSSYIMEHIKDEDVFDMAASHLEHSLSGLSEEAPARQMQFIITMSTHIPFIKPMPIFKSAGGVFSRYVSSLRYLDQCLAAYYAQLPEGTVLFLWGDHGSDVEYPRGFPDNERHVPFLVHVKGDNSWLPSATMTREQRAQPYALPSGRQAADKDGTLPIKADMETLAAEAGVARHSLSSSRIFTLCELGYYLRRALR